MATFNVESMLEQLKRAYIIRVTKAVDDSQLCEQNVRKLDAEALASSKASIRLLARQRPIIVLPMWIWLRLGLPMNSMRR